MLWEAASSYEVKSTFVANVDFVATVEIASCSGSYKFAELSVNTSEEITVVRKDININNQWYHIVEREMRTDGTETIDDKKEDEEEVNNASNSSSSSSSASVGSKRKRKPPQRFGAVQVPTDVVTAAS